MGIQSHLFVPVDLAECVALAMCREDFASLARRTLRSLRFIARIGLVSQLAPEFDWYDVGERNQRKPPRHGAVVNKCRSSSGNTNCRRKASSSAGRLASTIGHPFANTPKRSR